MSDNERHEKGMALRAELLGPKLDATCSLDALDRDQARQLVSDEL